jgi:hypothetical protein
MRLAFVSLFVPLFEVTVIAGKLLAARSKKKRLCTLEEIALQLF